jgi:hypothetical protein
MNWAPEHLHAMKQAGESIRADLLARRRKLTRTSVEDAMVDGPYLEDPALDFLFAQDDDVYEAGAEKIIDFALAHQEHRYLGPNMTTLSRMLGESAPEKSTVQQIAEAAKTVQTSIKKVLLEGKSEVGEDGLLKNYIQYVQQGNNFTPAGKVVLADTLVPCAFNINRSMEGVYFTKVKPKTDALMMFEDSSMTKVIQEIDRFWERKEQYDKLGLMHSRGILMYGPPGNGKSACLQQVVEMMVKRGDVVFFCNNPGLIVEGLKAFRSVEPARRVVICFEEADELANYDERALLQLLDGDNKQDNVLYLATTNYINRLSPRMLRPGRFDKKVYVATPNLENRKKYLVHKLKDLTDSKTIDHLAAKTDGMGFGHLRELIAGVFAMGDPIEEVLQRLREGVVNESEQKEQAALESKPGQQPLTEGMGKREYGDLKKFVKGGKQNRFAGQPTGKAPDGTPKKWYPKTFGKTRGESVETLVDQMIGEPVEEKKKRALDIKPVGKRVPRTFVAHRKASVPESTTLSKILGR